MAQLLTVNKKTRKSTSTNKLKEREQKKLNKKEEKLKINDKKNNY